MGIFTFSYIFTVVCLLLAYFWGEHAEVGSGFTCVFIAATLGILEVSLSFDNAVVNAAKLEKMSQVWQKRFLTWGIAIAVFGMRFLFPILIVAIFANLDLLSVLPLAINEPLKYAEYLHQAHTSVVSFGGAFLLMLFLNYFMTPKKNYWIVPLEKFFNYLSRFKYLDFLIIALVICFTLSLNPVSKQSSILIPAFVGAAIFTIINKMATFIEQKEENCPTCNLSVNVAQGGFMCFLYLELIDASFSLDGVLGAFAFSHDIVIISLGLCIGAIFVRSLTIMLVQKKTLKNFVFLESGAHWAIGALALIMFISTAHEVPELITAISGLAFILSSLYSSIKYNRKSA